MLIKLELKKDMYKFFVHKEYNMYNNMAVIIEWFFYNFHEMCVASEI